MSNVVPGLGSIGTISPLPQLPSLQPAEGQVGSAQFYPVRCII